MAGRSSLSTAYKIHQFTLFISSMPLWASTAPHHTTSHYTTPHHTSPHQTTPHYTTPHHTTPQHTTPHHSKPHLTTPCQCYQDTKLSMPCHNVPACLLASLSSCPLLVSCLWLLCACRVEKLGYPVPVFDFRLPGVTSMSADIHKYGLGIKVQSVTMTCMYVRTWPLYVRY